MALCLQLNIFKYVKTSLACTINNLHKDVVQYIKLSLSG